jgi:hypothetical protein
MSTENKDVLIVSDVTEGGDEKPWRFLTNHTQVLLAIAQDPDIRLRDIAGQVGITERAVQRIVADLVRSGFVDCERVGRRNRYVVKRTAAMHNLPRQRTVGELIDLLGAVEADSGVPTDPDIGVPLDAEVAAPLDA